MLLFWFQRLVVIPAEEFYVGRKEGKEEKKASKGCGGGRTDEVEINLPRRHTLNGGQQQRQQQQHHR